MIFILSIEREEQPALEVYASSLEKAAERIIECAFHKEKFISIVAKTRDSVRPLQPFETKLLATLIKKFNVRKEETIRLKLDG